MSNAITFIIDLQDKLSAKVQNLSNNSHKLQRKFAEMIQPGITLNDSLQDLSAITDENSTTDECNAVYAHFYRL